MLKWYSMLTFIVPFDTGVGPRAAATGPPINHQGSWPNKPHTKHQPTHAQWQIEGELS